MRKLLFAGGMLALVATSAVAAVPAGADFLRAVSAVQPLATVVPDSAVDTVVSIPWGDWLYDAATTLIAIIGMIIAWGVRNLPARFAAIVQTAQLDQLLMRAIDYGINTTAGAAKGKNLSIDVGSVVLEQALQYAIDNAPKWLIAWAGGVDGIKAKIIARLDLDASAAVPEVVQ